MNMRIGAIVDKTLGIDRKLRKRRIVNRKKHNKVICEYRDDIATDKCKRKAISRCNVDGRIYCTEHLIKINQENGGKPGWYTYSMVNANEE